MHTGGIHAMAGAVPSLEGGDPGQGKQGLEKLERWATSPTVPCPPTCWAPGCTHPVPQCPGSAACGGAAAASAAAAAAHRTGRLLGMGSKQRRQGWEKGRQAGGKGGAALS